MKKINMANLPTKIEKLETISKLTNKNIFIKRDDYTGLELSGNKVRKLEYILADALEKEADTILTCGAIQSNHARATSFAARKLGLEPVLLLAGDSANSVEGNRFLNMLAGAEIKFVGSEEYDSSQNEIMEEMAEELIASGKNPYIIPQGASNGLGSLGYIECYREILEQEKELGINFDVIVVTVGSAGTYAGLVYGSELADRKIDILGFNISGSAKHTAEKVMPKIIKEINEILGEDVNPQEYNLVDDYIGLGYAKSTIEEIELIKDFVKSEGIIIDPVYTGKTIYGLIGEIRNKKLEQYKNILFIHTGGAFGWAEHQRNLIF